MHRMKAKRKGSNPCKIVHDVVTTRFFGIDGHAVETDANAKMLLRKENSDEISSLIIKYKADPANGGSNAYFYRFLKLMFVLWRSDGVRF
jgi:hypothetical protein